MAKAYTRCAWCERTIEKKGVNKFLSRITMGIAGKQKYSYCSKKCQLEAEAVEKGNTLSGNQSQNFPSGANASGVENVTVVNKGDGFGASVAKGLFGMTNNFVEESRKGMKEQETKVENQINDITTMTFGTTADEISNQLNQLVSIANAKPDKKVKNAIIEKIEFGILKLKKMNAVPEADFFEKRIVALKKRKFFN